MPNISVRPGVFYAQGMTQTAPHERLNRALWERKKDRKNFPGLTWRLLSEQLAERGYRISYEQMRKVGSTGENLTRDLADELESLLRLPQGWLFNAKSDDVPPPVDDPKEEPRHAPQRSVVRIIVGGTTLVFDIKELPIEETPLEVLGGNDVDNVYVKVVDATLIGVAEPGEILAFTPARTPKLRKLLLVRNRANPDMHSIRKLDPNSGKYFDPLGRLDPLEPDEWDCVGIAVSRHMPDGFTV